MNPVRLSYAREKSTKSGKEARQYIDDPLASQLRQHIHAKDLESPVFDLPHSSNMARMLREDVVGR